MNVLNGEAEELGKLLETEIPYAVGRAIDYGWELYVADRGVHPA